MIPPLRSRRLLRQVVSVLAALTMTATVAACDVPPVGDPTVTEDLADSDPGGVLTTMSLGPVQTWDPQRIASRSDAAFAARVFARTLTSYQHGPDDAARVTLTGDLATDTGETD